MTVEQLQAAIIDVIAKLKAERDAASRRANDCAVAHNRLYEKNRALVEALQAARDLIWSTLAHVSHGGPTRAEAQTVHDLADAALKANAEPKP